MFEFTIFQRVSMTFQTALSRRMTRFARDEDGTLIVFALLLFTLMIMMGGLAIDLMRYETSRVALQQTLDRSTLAAAALTQTQTPESVVRDYMLKAGMQDQLTDVQVVDGMNFRSVATKGTVDTKPFFLHMLGISDLNAQGASAAEQGLSNVEIALVLDVSGSMSGQKIVNLRLAAANFVDTMLAQDEAHRVSISIVPYNAQVNIGPLLRGKYNATYANGVADVNCLELPTSVYADAALSRTQALPMMAYADSAYGTNQTNGYVSPLDATWARPNYGSAYCKPTTVNVVRLPSNDGTVLKAQIAALTAGGNTSITLGMKWGLSMLDPSARPMFDEFIASGDIPNTLPGRPFDYDDPQSMKVIVLMTDGEHVSHDRITDAYKAGPSNIYKSTGDGNYSVYFANGRPAVAGTNTYFVPHLGTWQAGPWNSGAGVVQQDWTQIWSNLKMTYVAWQFYARALGTDNGTRTATYNAQVAAMRATYESVATMDGHLQDSCNLAKANGVIVYGLTVQAPTHGQDVIRACASSDAHYFEADPATISNAFALIATNITQLKLTQ
jgi:Flp pilus assembly protein TadG